MRYRVKSLQADMSLAVSVVDADTLDDVRRQVQALADHFLGCQKNRAVLANHEEFDITALLDRFKDGQAYFIGP